LQTLAISARHAGLAARFDWGHRDPWGRILAAQTRLEHCAIVSADPAFDAVLHERI
jgi:PIN domain nuclease of toxin-antitoxin system